MRVVQVIDSLEVGGAERMAVNISNALVNDGHKVLCLVTRKTGPLLGFFDSKVCIVYVKKRSSFDLVALINFLLSLKKFKPDVVHSHSTSIVWSTFAKVLMGSKWMLLFHDHFGLSESLKDGQRRVLRYLSVFIDRVIVVNDKLELWSRNNLKIKKSNIFMIKNFPMIDGCEVKPRFMGDQIKLLCLANFRPQKDHFNLINAFAILVDKYPSLNLKLILAGQFNDIDYYNHVIDEIVKKKLNNKISVLGAVENVSKLISSCDIGILSSKSEGLPVSLLEYGFFSMPVVVTDVGQCAEVVGYGKYGKVVNPSDSMSLVKAISELLLDTKSAVCMGDEFKKNVELNYGSRSFLRQYYKLICSHNIKTNIN